MKAFLVKYTFSSRLHLLALAFLCQTAGVLCETSSALFEQAISDTREMKISVAFEKLEEAYRQEPNLPGLAEYTAWQNYLAGYHDQKTIELFEAALPNSQDPTAVQAALGHLRHELGVENGVAPGPAKRPAQAPPAEQPADRLQYARELYWSGSPEEAKAILQELIGEKADEPLLRLELARVLAALQENSAAADEIQTARFLRPGDRRLQTALDQVALKLAAQRPAPKLQTPPDSVAAILWREGQEAEARLDLFGAREAYRSSLKANPTLPGLRENVAWFYILNEFQNHECLALFEALASNGANTGAIREAIAMLRQKLGVEPAKPSKPVSAPAAAPSSLSSDKERLAYARELFWSGSPGESALVLQGLIQRYPDEPALRLALGNVLMAQNDNPAAVQELKKAKAWRPGEPEIALALSRAEAMQGHRTAALRALKGVEFPDKGSLHLAKAQAYHYAAEFFPASYEYRKAMACRPHDEAAAHGLAETSLRNGSVPEARQLLSHWPGVALSTDWSNRLSLERDIAAPRLEAGSSYFGNNLEYSNWNIGGRFQFRPLDSLETGVSSTYGLFQQTGFSSIQRVTGAINALWQPGDLWALSGRFALNAYDTGWTSPNGGVGLMVRPFSTLQLDVAADHLDVVDSEPALGFSLYDLAATIGAAAGRATMDVLSLSGTWTPFERFQVFGKYRLASLSGDNTMNDYYLDASYLAWRKHGLRVGYGLSQTMFSKASPVYQEGKNSTSYYYDPENLIVQNFYASFASPITRNLTLGGEGHFYQQPINGGIGTGLFAFLRYSWLENQALRLDARWFSQDRGLNRDGSSSSFYNALNLVAVYEFQF